MNVWKINICKEYIGEILKEYLEQELDEFSFLLESDYEREELIKEYTSKILDDWWIHYGLLIVEKARELEKIEMEMEE